MRIGRPKVLVLSRSYPNQETPLLGIWTEALMRRLADRCDLKVIAPVPYCPPLPGLSRYTRFRRVPVEERRNGIAVLHPRFLTGPGYSLHNFEDGNYRRGVNNLVRNLRKDFDFNLIHAHFSFPDGVVAAALARDHGVPFVITEHAPWVPWMENYPRVRRRAVQAAHESAFQIAVSNYARDTIAQFTGLSERLVVLPNGVDTEVFSRDDGTTRKADQILFVGFLRRVKGVDLLLKAMRTAIDRKPSLRLVIVGGGFYESYRRQEEELRGLASELGLDANVEFVGMKPPSEVASFMRESSLLVLPSRSETFGAVLIEAMACGTPVLATRCGGPEEIVNDEVGRLVPKEDVAALAKAILEMTSERNRYDSGLLRRYAVENFSWEKIADRTVDLYQRALAGQVEG